MSDFTIKQRDNLPIITAQFVDASGAPINLTGASVKFIMTDKRGTVLVNELCDIVDALAGKVEYRWREGDTSVPGLYWAEFEIVWPAGLRLTIPHDRYLEIAIVKDLA